MTAQESRHPVSDDCLFPLPRDLATWDGCVEVWNDCVDFTNHWERVLRDSTRRGKDGALAPEDFLVWDRDLDRLIGRLQLASRVQEMAFEAACRLRYGFGIGSVLDVKGDGDQRILVQVRGGGLPRRGAEPDVRLTVNMVEEHCGRHLSASVGFPMLQFSPDEGAHEFKVLSGIDPIQPSSPSVPPLPIELFGEVISALRRKTNPTGMHVDRASVLLEFWEQTMTTQRAVMPYTSGDILRVKPKSGAAYHVVFHYSNSEAAISCINPLRRGRDDYLLGSSTTLSTGSNSLSLAIAGKDYLQHDSYLNTSASLVMAMRETSRAQNRG